MFQLVNDINEDLDHGNRSAESPQPRQDAQARGQRDTESRSTRLPNDIQSPNLRDTNPDEIERSARDKALMDSGTRAVRSPRYP